jgi:hypothetical protein
MGFFEWVHEGNICCMQDYRFLQEHFFNLSTAVLQLKLDHYVKVSNIVNFH